MQKNVDMYKTNIDVSALQDGDVASRELPGANPDWVPAITPGRYVDRTDIRWAHPAIQDMLKAGQYMSEAMLASLYEPAATREERVAVRDQMAAANAGALAAMGISEKFDKQYFTAKGLREGDDDLTIVVSRPKGSEGKKLDVLYAISFGAMANADELTCDLMCGRWAAELGIAMVSTICRTGIDAPYPTPLDDLEAGYRWMLENGEELGLNVDNVIMIGGSGGGYTALGFAFRCKAVGFKPKGILVMDPVMGENFSYNSSRIINGMWDALNVHRAFKAIVRHGDMNSPFPSPEIAPDRASVEDMRGLCPIYIHASELDPSRDPAAHFASKCWEAGTFAQLHVWGAIHHGSLTWGDAPIQQAFKSLVLTELRDMLEYDFRREWLNE